MGGIKTNSIRLPYHFSPPSPCFACWFSFLFFLSCSTFFFSHNRHFRKFSTFQSVSLRLFLKLQKFSQLLSNLCLWSEERLARDFLTNQNIIGWGSLVASDWKTKWHVIFWPIKIARNVERPFHLIRGDSGQLANAVLQNTKNFLKKKLLYCLLLICRGWNWKEDNCFYRWCATENRKRNKRVKWKT